MPRLNPIKARIAAYTPITSAQPSGERPARASIIGKVMEMVTAPSAVTMPARV